RTIPPKIRPASLRNIPSMKGTPELAAFPKWAAGVCFWWTKKNYWSIRCPTHWVRLGGLDPAWTHYAAFCECWWDRDLDIYIWCGRCGYANKRCCNMRMPCDLGACAGPGLTMGGNRLGGRRCSLMRQYRDAGLDMMHEKATFEDGGVSVEAGV